MMETGNSWWENPLRIIQTNLQVKDTQLIDPEKLAYQIREMGANVLVFNVGGIYAWYPTKVPCHTVNPFLPKDTDLLDGVIKACHKNDIRFVARFDFSKAEDTVYLSKPHWFVRKQNHEPEIIGGKRAGNWSLLMSTCINGDYRSHAVAIPVLGEVLDKYEIDGIFYNNPGFIPCCCDNCRRKYRKTYGKELPLDPIEYEATWSRNCVRDNMGQLYSFIKSKNNNIPVILYYHAFGDDLLFNESITDLLVGEPQDVLSRGHNHIPEYYKPSICVKIGKTLQHKPAPMTVVHSCPGMDWRHTGLPSAEYRYWLSQVPANGGTIWHSLTGIPDTITDKRILHTVSTFNRDVMKVEKYMKGAVSASQVVLLWNDSSTPAHGIVDALIQRQIPFDVLLPEQVSQERLQSYKAVIIPDNWKYSKEFIQTLSKYVDEGGNALLEGKLPYEYETLYDLLGISGETFSSEELAAAYLRFEGDHNPLQNTLEETALIQLRGKVTYCRPNQGTDILLTLVPPFAPLDGVGAPPERASIPVAQTDIPMCIMNRKRLGTVIYFPFSVNDMIDNFRLEDHYILFSNAVALLLGEERLVKVSCYPNLQLSIFRNGKDFIVHLVNGAGYRPLTANIPLYDIEIEIRLPEGDHSYDVKALIEENCPVYTQEDQRLHIRLPQLKVWEALLIEQK